MLLGRQGFARQHRLVQEKILGFEKDQIAWNHIAGREVNDIAGNEDFAWNFRERSVGAFFTASWQTAPPYAGGVFDHRSQFCGGIIRAVLFRLNSRSYT